MRMNAAEVRRMIEEEIAGEWGRSNLHGVDLKACLVSPTFRMFEDGFNQGASVALWLVLEEDPVDKKGYKIVFNDQTKEFGLAVPGTASDVFIGYHGTFLQTLEGM